MAGDQLPGGTVLASAEIYSPVTGTFSAAGNMTVPRCFQTATPLDSGKVLITGGYIFIGSQTDVAASAELYNPAQ